MLFESVYRLVNAIDRQQIHSFQPSKVISSVNKKSARAAALQWKNQSLVPRPRKNIQFIRPFLSDDLHWTQEDPLNESWIYYCWRSVSAFRRLQVLWTTCRFAGSLLPPFDIGIIWPMWRWSSNLLKVWLHSGQILSPLRALGIRSRRSWGLIVT